MSSPNKSEISDLSTATSEAKPSVASLRPPAKPRSLRFELLVSELLILSLVVVGFGSSIYFLVRRATYH
jgi:hypothetical protein